MQRTVALSEALCIRRKIGFIVELGLDRPAKDKGTCWRNEDQKSRRNVEPRRRYNQQVVSDLLPVLWDLPTTNNRTEEAKASREEKTFRGPGKAEAKPKSGMFWSSLTLSLAIIARGSSYPSAQTDTAA
jgi:hypothetical protein